MFEFIGIVVLWCLSGAIPYVLYSKWDEDAVTITEFIMATVFGGMTLIIMTIGFMIQSLDSLDKRVLFDFRKKEDK